MLPVKKSFFPKLVDFFDDDWADLFDWSHKNFSQTQTTLPSVNIRDLIEEYLVEVAAPGLKKEDFSVNIHNNILTIKSEKKEEKQGETRNDEGTFTRQEFSYQSFVRSFNLNDKMIEADKIKAEYLNGILKVHLPKKEDYKDESIKTIDIS